MIRSIPLSMSLRRAGNHTLRGLRTQSTSSKGHPLSRVPVGGLAAVAEVRAQLPSGVAELVKDYPSIINLPVQWGEQDVYGHLNNVTYVRYFESGRIAYFDQIIKPHLSETAYTSFITARGVGPIAKSVLCKYRAPVMYPDTVTVAVRIDPSSVKKDRFTQSAVIVSHAQERVVAEGECVVVSFDYKGQKKADIPKEIINAWKKGEGLE
ncbi:YbgC/YbaW family acyl-CoA thioester hydrolase [Spizellomyces punctatus DAOM BR117]|uniref:YbgC/YbaW family acyl-CoA thioester hydrolase n=1 Tax=Spizellomyces punctatus (strain DAOM BR117) TaxID=645134 RepID=A0A0L0H6K7_SPIPD|nr:YbgC/YbaW family acyl-CoA thioester hydrolase [Spizellomyces punctatus DAOM BR117]KNC96594.1 YbgC/YbaW family acyl-CoA thioester hydrolase [Spizellomyces punctatus DAOM BR117]|eukprot:XP_016604634.1 YbgC/YbaW family acyl-CoA thioester hydrolase [Spizellomyces punctatus DAOM BR117]